MPSRQLPKDIAVQRAGPAEIAALVGLMAEFHGESGRALDGAQATQSFQRLLEDADRGAAWIARRGSDAAGYVVLTRKHSMDAPGDDGFIEDLYVRPSFRRQGVGSALLSMLFDECRRSRISLLQVEVNAENRAATSLYYAFGLMGTQRRMLMLRIANGTPTR